MNNNFELPQAEHILNAAHLGFEKPVEKQEKLLGRVPINKGHKFFELDLQARTIRTIDLEKTATITGATRIKFVTKEGCLYCTALNLKNAEKKFIKMLNECRVS